MPKSGANVRSWLAQPSTDVSQEWILKGRTSAFGGEVGKVRNRRDLALRDGIREGRQSLPTAVILRNAGGRRLWSRAVNSERVYVLRIAQIKESSGARLII